MDLVLGDKRPLDAVALKKPKFIWEKSVRLDGLVSGFSTDVRVVGGRRICRRRNDQGRNQQHPAQTDWEQNAFHFLPLKFCQEFLPMEAVNLSSTDDSFYFLTSVDCSAHPILSR
jgi:hypothetical protein